MINTLLCKSLSLILRFIQSHDKVDPYFLEDWNIIFWHELAISIFLRDRSRKRYKLLIENPMKIAILHLFIMLVLSGIERFKLVPAKCHREFQPLQTVMNRASVRA